MVFLAGPLIDRFGKKLVLAAGFLCSAAALVGMAYAPSYAVLGALLVMLGLGGCSAMAAANTLIPDLYPKNPSSALNLGGIFFGVGAVFFPWLVALMARRLGLVATLWFIALLVGLVAVVALAQKFPPRAWREDSTGTRRCRWRSIPPSSFSPACCSSIPPWRFPPPAGFAPSWRKIWPLPPRVPKSS